MEFKIRNNLWKVIECSNSEAPMCDGLFCGRTYHFEKTVFINEALTYNQKIDTFLHELCHVILAETQIISQEKDFTFTEEMLCEFLAKYYLIIQPILNKFIKYLNERNNCNDMER